MNNDQVAGRIKEAEGKVQEVAGKIVGNPTQEAKGVINKTVGAAQAKFGDLKQEVQQPPKDMPNPI
jgi:uncharacterized protein YjbJ (UPF0337 family)